MRDRHVSPSSLSNSSCCDDMPIQIRRRAPRRASAHLGLFVQRAGHRRGGPRQTHRRGTDVAVPEESTDVGPQRFRFQRRHVLVGRGPGFSAVDGVDDMLPRNGFHLPKRSPASVPSTWTVDSEHDPTSTVVTP